MAWGTFSPSSYLSQIHVVRPLALDDPMKWPLSYTRPVEQADDFIKNTNNQLSLHQSSAADVWLPGFDDSIRQSAAEPHKL
jgi:hypothetical protein